MDDKLKKILKNIIICVLIPSTLILQVIFFDEKYHIAFSISVAVLSLILFFSSFEKKKITSRRLVISSFFIALSVVGRFIPLLKPVTALTIIGGMYLGTESGFLIGAGSALISNFYFGQGPWTPFQMVAWGLIGFLSSIFSKYLKKSKITLFVFGAFSGILYSLVLDIWSVMWAYGEFNLKLYITALITAIPHTVLYCVSTILFLLLICYPIGKKIERIKIKYGI